MGKSLLELLGKPWPKQADYLRSLSRRDLEVLWYDLQVFRETFEHFSLAVYSVLRDTYEAERQETSS